MPRLKKKWMTPQPVAAPTKPCADSKTDYFRMRDGKKEVGVPFWTLYGLYQRGELRAASLTPGGALYVKRSDFDLMWQKKLEATMRAAA
jgi:hypothetical protein